jgi:hypothetical protein
MTHTTTRLRGLRLVLLTTLLPLGACVATVGANRLSVPKDSAQICARHCEGIGLRLSAVAIMAENVGCVCQAAPAPNAPAGTAGELSTPAAGMATIAAQQAAAAVAAAQTTQRMQQRRY